MQIIMLGWIGIMSLWAFVAMGYDKRQAKRNGQRVPEKNLWTLALFGGGIGAFIGMQIFRHKTRRTSFRIGFLMLALAYGIAFLYFLDIKAPSF